MSPSSANCLAFSRFKFLPVNTCASNSFVKLDSKSNKLSAAVKIVDKLVPIFAASIAACANPSAPPFANAANFSVFAAMSSMTLPAATPSCLANWPMLFIMASLWLTDTPNVSVKAFVNQ